MEENEPIEQPDIPEVKKTPQPKPESFGYRRFERTAHQAALSKAKTAKDIEGEEETKRLEAELEQTGDGGKKTLKPQNLRALDQSVKLTEEEKKAPKKEMESMEKRAFLKIIKTLQESNKLPIQAEDQTHIFEFKGLTKDGKDVQPNEVEKLLEHIDQGGDVPPNIEFHFQTSFKKGREETEAMDVNYRMTLRQIMMGGLETTLSSLLSLSYTAASVYDRRKGKTATEGGEIEVERPKEEPGKGELDNLRRLLNQRNIQTSTIQTGQWAALEVAMPEKQKQVVIVYDGAVFQVTEKRPDQTLEVPVTTPAEIMQYIDKESK